MCVAKNDLYRVSHYVVTIETGAIGWQRWLITFWYVWIWRIHVNAQCMSMYNCFEIQRYQNVINQGGHPIALVSMVTTLWEKSLFLSYFSWFVRWCEWWLKNAFLKFFLTLQVLAALAMLSPALSLSIPCKYNMQQTYTQDKLTCR